MNKFVLFLIISSLLIILSCKDNKQKINVNDKNFSTWPCRDHENNATEKFLEDVTNKKAGEFANLWFQETEDIVNSIKLE